MENKLKVKSVRLIVMAVMLTVLIACTAIVALASSTPMYHVGVGSLAPPVAGRLPDCDVVPNGQYTASVQWFYQDSDGYTHHTESEPLQAGVVYQAAVHLCANSRYYFDTESQFFDCSINGIKQNEYRVISETHVIIFHTYPALDIAPVGSVDVTVDTPRALSHPDFSAEVTGDCVLSYYDSLGYVDGVFWTDTVTGKVLTAEDTFVAGRTYRVQVVIKADSNHYFDNSSANAVRINGKTAYITTGDPTPDKDYYRVASATFTAPETINEINVKNFVEPVVGHTPAFWVDVDVDGVEVRKVSWGVLKDVDGVEKVVDIDENYVFQDGETYMLCTMKILYSSPTASRKYSPSPKDFNYGPRTNIGFYHFGCGSFHSRPG